MLRVFLVLLSMIVATSAAHAAGKTVKITASASVLVGENRSKQQAKEEAKKEAARKAVEEAAGVVIQSTTTVKNMQLESDEIKSASVAFVKSIKELEATYNKETDRFTFKGEFTVDTAAMEEYAAALPQEGAGKEAEKEIQIYFALYDSDERLLKDGTKVNSGSQYQLMVQTFQRTFLYIINRDSSGAVYMLFPNPEIPVINPLEANREYFLPGADNMLEFDNVKGLETFYLIASTTPQKDIDVLFKQIKELGGDAPKELATAVENRIKSRGGGAIVQKFSGATAKFSRKNVKMAAEILKSTGALVRQINLVHE